MQNINEDTEWNAILREKGILPPKEKPKMEEEPEPVDERERFKEYTLDDIERELEELEDGGGSSAVEEAKVLEDYRAKRLAELYADAQKQRFGSLRSITKSDWKMEVNDADPNTFIVIHLAQQGKESCNILDDILKRLSLRFPTIKFLRGEATQCVENYPDANVPSLLVYKSNDLKFQFIGEKSLGGMKGLTLEAIEWRLGKVGVLQTNITEDPTSRINIKTNFKLRANNNSSDDSD